MEVLLCDYSHGVMRPTRTVPCVQLPVGRGLHSSISLRITRDILIAKGDGEALRPPRPRRACYGLQLVCGAVRRFREKCSSNRGMHGLVFRRSIHYWQDQPGSKRHPQAVWAPATPRTRPPPPPGGGGWGRGIWGERRGGSHCGP